jgi:sulfatase modifying factor 1
MRASVVGIAVVMCGGMVGLGVLAWSAFHGPGKAKPVKIESERAAPAAGSRTARPLPGRARRDPGHDGGDPHTPGGAFADTPDEPDGPPHPGDAPPPGLGNGGPARRAGADGEGDDTGLSPRPGGTSWANGGVRGGATDPGLQGAADGGSQCPNGMVDTGSFCVDATEVTNTAYLAFLNGGPKPSLQLDVCRWNGGFTPFFGAPPADTRPVVAVNWCDAYAYCAAVGKSLCGHIGGGPNGVAAFADPMQSAWFSVCTNGGTTRWPYGNTFDDGKCFHASDDGNLAPVGSYPACVGAAPPYDGVFDMGGNAWEWEDSCTGNGGAGDLCRVRGGSQQESAAPADCATDYLARRDGRMLHPDGGVIILRPIGFRCCSQHT